MKKLVFVLLLFISGAALFAQTFKKESTPVKNSYVMYLKPCDFGPAVEKIEVNLGRTVLFNSVNKEDFEVAAMSGALESFTQNSGIVKSIRPVKNAYISDGKGQPSEDTISQFITLEFDTDSYDKYTVPFNDSKLIKTDVFYNYRITNSKMGIFVKDRYDIVCPEASVFTEGSHLWRDSETADTVTLNYNYYLPENKTEKIPLIVFFHGMGEAGEEACRSLLNIKSVNLAGNDIQQYFENGAAVLIPQCPTGWMEITDKDPFGNRLWVVVDIDGAVNNAVEKVTSPLTNLFSKLTGEKLSYTSTVKTPVSYYSAPIKELIDNFIEENPQIDTERIYIGGCSAGGYMTVNMMIHYSDFFAAAFPICEAFPDNRISDSDMKKLSQKPLWFTVSLDDETINPQKNTLPTVERLKNLGAPELHYVYYEHVTDTTGQYKNEKGDGPFMYDGHYSWVYVLNNHVEDKELKLFDWLSRQRNCN